METVIAQLRGQLRRRGHPCPLYVAHGKTYPRGDDVFPLYPRSLSWLYHSRLNAWVEKFFPRRPWTEAALRRVAHRPTDLLHLHNFHGDYAGLETLACLHDRKPLVWTFHAFWGITGGCDHPKNCRRYLDACGECPQVGCWNVGPVDRTREELALKRQLLGERALHIISPARHAAKQIQASLLARRWRVHHLPNGIDPAAFSNARKHDPNFRRSLGLAPDAPVVLIVNRDFKDPHKGFPMVETALRALPAAPAQLVWAGANGDWAAAQVPQTFSHRVLGYVPSRAAMAQWYEAADIFLFASPAETFPCVVLEAMAAGCCVVSTPTSGVDEQIEPGVSGLLGAEVSGAALAPVLRAALASADLRARCGAAARQRVSREFSEDRMVERHLELYELIRKERADASAK